MSDPLGGIEIFGFAGVLVTHHEAVHRPCLASCPRGTLFVTLAAVCSDNAAFVRVEFHDMMNRTVHPDECRHGRIRMSFRNLLESRITRLFRCPVKERNVEHAVDNRPAARITVIQIIPGANKAAGRVESSCQQRSGVHGSFRESGFDVSLKLATLVSSHINPTS